MPVVVDISPDFHVVRKPQRKLTGRTPYIKNFGIYCIVCSVRIPYRRKMHSVIVGAVFVRFEHIRAAYFFKKAVVFCRGLAVEIEFRKQRIDFLCVCAVFGIPHSVAESAQFIPSYRK